MRTAVKSFEPRASRFNSFAWPWRPERGTAYFTVLDAEEISRRLKAAREFRGMTQAQLADLVAEDGLDKHTLGKVERGAPLQRAYRVAAAHHLRVPEAWFTEPQVELMEIVHYDSRIADALELLREQVEDLASDVLDGVEAQIVALRAELAERQIPPQAPPEDQSEAG